jgi:hypothetical protein
MDFSLLSTLSPSYLRDSALVAVVSGLSSVTSITTAIGLKGNSDAEKAVHTLLQDPEFLRECEKARDRIDETVIKKFKQSGLKAADRMIALVDAEDPRVAFQATKDILDRIGTAPQQRVAVSGMQQYQSLLKELEKDEPDAKNG